MGDLLEYKARVMVTKAEAPGQFWGQETFGKWAVILNESIELHVPKGKYVKVWSPESTPAKTEAGDETVYRWTGANLEPLIGKDGKTKQREVDPKGELPAIAWTTFKSWDEVGAWYRGLEADRVIPDAEVKAKAAELTAGKTTEEEKARAVYGYVATQIRYIGVAFGIGRYQPHPAAEVLRNQYGDCKDKHTLLAAMLTAAGMHPEAAMIGAGIRMNEEVPSPGAFNHMITTVPVSGKQVWLDATAEVAPYQMLVSVIRDKQALVVPDTGVAKLERTPAALPFAPFSKFVAKGTLSAEGTMKAQIEYTTRGDDELVFRTVYRQVPPGQWAELTQRLSQGLGFGGTTSHPEATKPDNTSEPERLAYDYEREKTGDWDNHRIVALLPVVFLSSVDEKNPPQKVPIALGEPRVETSLSVVKLPEGWGADLPAAVHQKATFASFDKTYKIEGSTLTVERRVEVLAKEVPAADWKAYKKWLDATLSEGESYIQLMSTGTKTGEQTPPAAGANNAEAAELVKEAYKQVQRGEANAAEATLDKAKRINNKQSGLWSTYGYLNYQRRNWNDAVAAYKKELAQYPDTLWVYRAMAQAQMNSSHWDDGLDTLRALVKRDGATDDDRNRLAMMLVLNKSYAEALPLLETLAAATPDDLGIKTQLGIAEMHAGRQEAGRTALVSVLKEATDPPTLNNGAYELAEAGVELELAEKSARDAVDSLTTESIHWTLPADVPDPNKETVEKASIQNGLIAAWDTLGWVLYREGKLDEAESYVRAAWLNSQSAEGGLHLGDIEAKSGHSNAALQTYQMALASVRKPTPGGFRPSTDSIREKLMARIASLKEQKAKPSTDDGWAALQDLRTIALGNSAGKRGAAEYSVILFLGKIEELKRSTGGQEVPDGDSMVEKADMKQWMPTGSNARLIRKGTLNCHATVCELVVHPM